MNNTMNIKILFCLLLLFITAVQSSFISVAYTNDKTVNSTGSVKILDGDGINASKLKLVNVYENGYSYQCEDRVLNMCSLKGSFYEMGKQYGYLYSSELSGFYKEIIDYLVNKRHVSKEKLLYKAQKLFSNYPQEYKEIFYGMSEMSGLTLDEHLVINAFEHYLFDTDIVGNESMAGCSAIAVWNKYSDGQRLIFGRNYDFGGDFSQFEKYLSVVVFNPVAPGYDNSNAVVTYLGTLNATTQMNNKGIFIELNAVGNYNENIVNDYDCPPIKLFRMAFDADNLEKIDTRMQFITTKTAYTINVADNKEACSYAWSPTKTYKLTNAADGLLVSTNHYEFDKQKWGTEVTMPTDNYFFTVLRKSNLLEFAATEKGNFHIGSMMRLLELPIPMGGATSYSSGTLDGKPLPFTMFQVIAIPSSMKLLIKNGKGDWTVIDLKSREWFR